MREDLGGKHFDIWGQPGTHHRSQETCPNEGIAWALGHQEEWLTASSGTEKPQNLKFPASSRASGPHRDGANREGLGAGAPPRRAPGSPTNR